MEFDCHYPGSSNVTVSQGYLQTIESRLKSMEERLSPGHGQVDSASRMSTSFTSTRSASVPSGFEVPVTVHEDQSPQTIDGMVSLGFVNEEQTSYFGILVRVFAN